MKHQKLDDPVLKERLMSQYFGEIVGFLKEEGLCKGNEYDTAVEEFFETTRKIIWIDEMDADTQINVLLNSLGLDFDFAVINKKSKEIVYRNRLENLRYRISDGEPLALIENHEEDQKAWWSDFKSKFFEVIKPKEKV